MENKVGIEIFAVVFYRLTISDFKTEVFIGINCFPIILEYSPSILSISRKVCKSFMAQSYNYCDTETFFKCIKLFEITVAKDKLLKTKKSWSNIYKAHTRNELKL